MNEDIKSYLVTCVLKFVVFEEAMRFSHATRSREVDIEVSFWYGNDLHFELVFITRRLMSLEIAGENSNNVL